LEECVETVEDTLLGQDARALLAVLPGTFGGSERDLFLRAA
jgi:hypothetical protein